MRKKWISLFAVITLIASLWATPAMADATKVVTLGANLSAEQEAFMINYFGVDLATAQVIYVNNQQEREYVGSWIPLEQIGNITISCAYVQPTTSGGIQVKTANLTYVKGNMIASVLSTAGVKNCNVVAAAPFPVSGTGALTGVMIAYQTATGEQLDTQKRDLAVQEFTVTQQASETIGENEALQLVNAVKMEVIQSEVPADDPQQIEQIVNEVINNVEQTTVYDNSTTTVENVTNIQHTLSDEDRQLIIDLATEIAKQEYQYEDVKETLERVEENLSKETNITIEIDNSNEVSNNTDLDISNNSQNDNSNQNDVSNDTSTDVNNSTNVENTANADNNADNDITNDVANDVNNEANNENTDDSDSILSNTNDDIIDISYQSSTRTEDIIAIENALEEETEQETETETSLYDMTMVEEYYEEPAQDSVNQEPSYTEPVIEDVYTEPVIEDVYTEPVIEEVYTEPVIENVYTEPIIEDVYTEPVIENVYTEPVIEDVYTEPVIEEIYTEPVIEDVYTEPVIEDVYTEPVIEDIYTEPVIEDVYTEPIENIEESQLPAESGAGESEEAENPEGSSEETAQEGDTPKAAAEAVLDTEEGAVVYGNMIRLFVQQENAQITEGTLKAEDQNAQVILESDLNDPDHVISVPMDQDDLDELHWQSGTEIDIFLPELQFEEGASVSISAQTAESVIETEAPLKKAEKVVILASSADDMRAGKSIQATAVLEDPDGYVSFETDDPSIAAVNAEESYTVFTEEGTQGQTVINLLQEGRSVFTVHCYGADGTEKYVKEVVLNVYPEKSETLE